MTPQAPTLLRRQPLAQPGPQRAFLSTPADFAFAGGAAGGGKTRSLLMEPLRHIARPQFGAVIFRREYPRIMQKGGLWEEAGLVYPQFGAQPRMSPMLDWTFPSGATVEFRALQHEKTKINYKGAQIPLMEFDQIEEFTEGQFWYLCSRLRSTSGVRPYVRATCNPVPEDDVIGGWVHRLLQWWIDPETGYAIPERSGRLRYFARTPHSGGDELVWGDTADELVARYGPKTQPQSLTFIRMLLSDNRILMDSDPGYERMLRNLPLVERERLLGANWNIRPAAGLLFNRAWFPLVTAAPAEGMVIARVRYWDKAGTEDGGAFSAGVKMARTADGVFYVEDVVRGQWSSMHRNRVMLQTAQLDGWGTSVWVEQEPGSGGKESAEASVQLLAGYDVHIERVTGDKESRARPLSAQAEAGNVRCLQGVWTKPFLDELHDFPLGSYKDQVDAASGAFNKLTGGPLVGPFDPAQEFLDDIPEDEYGGTFR